MLCAVVYLVLFVILPILFIFRLWERNSTRKRGPIKRKKEEEPEEDEGTKGFRQYLRNLKPTDDYKVTSEDLRAVIRKNYLRYEELQTNSLKFFKFHEIMAQEGDGMGGIGIKFTVQYNLYAGSVVFLGNEEQVKELKDSQKTGALGCFALTESSAGVLSGLIVSTIATLQDDGSIILSTPDIATTKDNIIDFDGTGAAKTWISQGHTCDYMVVFARLIVDEEDKGVHAFFLKMKDFNLVHYDSSVERSPMKKDTIYFELMEGKSTFNELDNSKIIFNEVQISNETMLSRYCVIDMKTKTKYRTRGGLEKFNFYIIAQRLLTGRAVIGKSALSYFLSLLDTVKKNVLNVRQIPMGSVSNRIPLKDLPHLRDFIADLEFQLDCFSIYVDGVLKDLAKVLKKGDNVDDNLVERISICKIVVTNFCISKIFELKSMIGSESLFLKNRLGSNLDVFYCCLFAEGDNRILQQKITRDHLYLLKKKKYGMGKMIFQLVTNTFLSALYWLIFSRDNLSGNRKRLEMIVENKCIVLGAIMSKVGKNREKKIKLWTDQYERVYKIADLVCEIELLKAREKHMKKKK